MPAFPSFQFTKDFIKVRFFDETAPASIGQRWLGMPRGVYLGFNPVVSAGSDILTLDVDANNNFSLLKVGSETQKIQVDLFVAEPLALNFTGHTQFPVYVVAKAEFPLGSFTNARILTRDTPASGPTEITICRVDKPAADLVLDVTEPANRQTPVAFQTQAFGYMPSNAIVDLASASASVAEIVAARTSPFTGPHSDLGTRINTDLSGDEMASRLGLRLVQVLGNVHESAAATSVNVSGSMTETGREFGPTLTIEAGGTESVEGAITASPGNVCLVIDSSTGQRVVDPSTEEPIYGVLTFTSGTVGLGKEIQFFNASTTVSGNGSNPFQSPIEEGDIVLGPDGKYYEIASFTDPDNAILGAAFQGATGSAIDAPFRRFTLSFFTVTGGVIALSAITNIRFLFPSFFRVDRAIFDGTLFIKKNGERPQVPDATTITPGKALLAAPGGLVGSVRTIKNAGSAIGTDFHTLNFTSGGAINLGGGIAGVSVPGAQGPDGPGANQGPDGPSGPAGPGYSVNNTFESSTFSSIPAPSSISHTVDFSLTSPSLSSIAHLFGGFSGFDWGATLQTVRITSISITGATTGRIIGDLGPAVHNARFKLFLGAMQ